MLVLLNNMFHWQFVGKQIYEDLQFIPNEDPCKRCKCNVGRIDCFKKDCPSPSVLRNCIQFPPEPHECCPKYECSQNSSLLTHANKENEGTAQLNDSHRGEVQTENTFLEGKEVLEEKDIQVFLNFTFRDVDMPTTEIANLAQLFTERLNEKVVDKLNTGIGYTIIPDGETPEYKDDNIILIVQTIRIYKNETIQIKTILPRDLQQNLKIIDQQIIKRIEKKTKKIVMDTLRETKKWY